MKPYRYQGRTIITCHISPPIPRRDHDWCAYLDDLGGDGSPYGWGKTEDEAVADLLDQIEEDDAI